MIDFIVFLRNINNNPTRLESLNLGGGVFNASRNRVPILQVMYLESYEHDSGM